MPLVLEALRQNNRGQLVEITRKVGAQTRFAPRLAVVYILKRLNKFVKELTYRVYAPLLSSASAILALGFWYLGAAVTTFTGTSTAMCGPAPARRLRLFQGRRRYAHLHALTSSVRTGAGNRGRDRCYVFRGPRPRVSLRYDGDIIEARGRRYQKRGHMFGHIHGCERRRTFVQGHRNANFLRTTNL